MGCRGARLCSGGLCSRQAAGVLVLDLQPELFSCHQVIWHGRRVSGGFFVDRNARFLIFLGMLAAAPKIANNTSFAAIEFGIQPRRAIDHGERVELVKLSVQQRRIDAMNIAWKVAH